MCSVLRVIDIANEQSPILITSCELIIMSGPEHQTLEALVKYDTIEAATNNHVETAANNHFKDKSKLYKAV